MTKKLQAMQNLFNQKPTIAGAQTVIKDIIEDSQPLPVTIQRVVDEVSRVTGISEEEIYSTKQQAAVTHVIGNGGSEFYEIHLQRQRTEYRLQ